MIPVVQDKSFQQYAISLFVALEIPNASGAYEDSQSKKPSEKRERQVSQADAGNTTIETPGTSRNDLASNATKEVSEKKFQEKVTPNWN